jgi:hypothetical protein
MVNHPNRRRTFKVQPLHGSSDTARECHFAVRGPRMDGFAEMDRVAGVMQRALNAPEPLTGAEYSAVRAALGFTLAGETDCFSDAVVRAMRSAHSKLST